MPDLLTVEEAAERLRLSRGFLYQLIRRGEIPTVKIGKARRIRPADLERFITAHVEADGPDAA